MLTVNKNRIIYLIKIITVIILLLLPLNMRAQIPADAEQYNWPLIIQQLESKFNTNQQDLQVRSELATAYNNYGLILAHKKSWIQAEAYLNKAVKTNPDATVIKQNLSNVYYQHAYELYNDNSKVHYTNYAHQDAKNLVNKALEINPDNVNALLLLGDIEYMNQQMGPAHRAWEKAAALVPTNQQVQKRLVQIKREVDAESTMHSIFDPFFIIRIDPEVSRSQNFDVSKMLSDIRTKVSRDFQYTQTSKLPVIVYSKTQYQDTIQDAPDWSEAAYDGKLRIGVAKQNQNITQLYSNVVHEYTHAVIDDITNKNIPRWLNEGIAKYEEYRHGIPPRIYVLALAYNTDSIIPWEKLDAAFLDADQTTALLAYQQSFSFVYYLVQRYGMSKLITLLKTLGEKVDAETAIQQVYQKPLPDLVKDWRLWLRNFIQEWAESSESHPASYE